MIDSSRPRARTDGISLAEVPDGLVLLDLHTSQYHALDETTTAVWRLADGSRSVAAIARDAGLAPDAVALALVDLAEVGLLATGDASRLDRRALLAKLTAAGIAVPVISSITAAGAEAAVSCTNPCNAPSCPGYCPMCDPAGCDPTGCTANPCISVTCPNYQPCMCDGAQCNPLCPLYDPCFCVSPCASGCGGQPCGDDCCLPPFTTCVNDVCVSD